MLRCSLFHPTILLAVLVMPAAVFGQEEEVDDSWQFSVNGGIQHRLEADIDGGGEFDLTRVSFGFSAGGPLESGLNLTLLGTFRWDDYGFSNARGLVDPALSTKDPWDEVYTVGFGGVFRWRPDIEVEFFGGPIIQFSRETDADWDDAFIGGGVVGGSYRFDENLKLGGGFGVVSQLEDDARFFPVFIIDWNITEQLKLTSQSGSGGFAVGGLELVYDFQTGWEVGLGGSYERRRFRLDDDGPARDGIGQDESIPVWARVTYRPNPNLGLHLRVGGVFEGELRLEDSRGDFIADRDYDEMFFVGFSAQVRF